MIIAAVLFQAFVLGVVASGVHSIILRFWPGKQFWALCAALTIVAWAIWSGPIPIG